LYIEIFIFQAVFNCGLNPAMKKKKLPSVLPPPPPTVVGGVKVDNVVRGEVPFWKEPLPQFDTSEWDPSDMGHKLQV
jgi:hypothetical protein